MAIVIPAHNEERFIGRCLHSCINQTSLPDEIIVVNNKSTDNTRAIVHYYQNENPHIKIRLLDQNYVQGLIPTRNAGFDHARSDIIGRIDADSIITNEWVKTLRWRFRDAGVAAATGPVFYYDMPLRRIGFWLDHMVRNTLRRYAKDQRFLYGANMAIRASAWWAIRRLVAPDREDRLHEDIDIALTLFKNGYEIAYDRMMVAGISARRMESSSNDFYRYTTRYLATTKAHDADSHIAYAVMGILLAGYPILRATRFFYRPEDYRSVGWKSIVWLPEIYDDHDELESAPGR
ncbi:glycosyltransferase family 2 protein [Mycobacterium lentiflavum]|uniref:glycosyltransferase family 2 protein n=1 Tax=Mycobacterium lentiflavum TaxID=141349 RepID=UPI001585F94D|nr:glycosyltransferase family 2 protein [Mycobacterium lentiflavum]